MDLINKQPDYDTLCLSDIIIYTVGAGIQSNLKENNHLIYGLNVTVPISICNKLKEYNYKGIVTIQEEITIFWADVDFFRLYN
jgi:hypothetical protein